MQPVLEIENLSASYEKNPVVYDISLTINSGQIIGIIGPNGAGKSSLVKTILGLIPKSSGSVKVFGKPIRKARSHIGYVPQRETIDWDFPVTVYDVVMMGRYSNLGLFRRPSKEDKTIVEHALQKVQMSDFAHRQISNLSGGQQQRVFLARALAQYADLYFMDEPFAGVDAITEAAIIEVLRELRSQGRTLIIIHHDLATAKEYFDKIILLNRQVIAFDTPEKVLTLHNLETAFEGKLHIFKVEK